MNNKKKVFFYLILFSIFGKEAFSQTYTIDTLDKNRKKIISSIALPSAAIGSQVMLYYAWYAPYNSGKFHFFNDWNEWRKMDKFGHAYSSYHLSSSIYDVLVWSGYSNKNSLLVASSSSWIYQGFIELMDGFSDGWGFSIPDLVFNSIGTGVFFVNKINKKSILFPKFSYLPSKYAQYRPEILGKSSLARILKDYNAQTYWLGIRPNTLIPSIKANWLLFSIGYSINEHLIGNQLTSIVNGTTYNSYTQLLFSIDIDPTQLPIENRLLKKLLFPLKYVKIPFPALAFQRGNLTFFPIYF